MRAGDFANRSRADFTSTTLPGLREDAIIVGFGLRKRDVCFSVEKVERHSRSRTFQLACGAGCGIGVWRSIHILQDLQAPGAHLGLEIRLDG